MAKTVDTTFTATELDRNLFSPGKDVDIDDWKALVSNMHYLWARSGARIPGPILNPQFTTTSTTYTTTNGNTSSDYSLKTWFGVAQPCRRIEVSGSFYYRFTFVGYGKNIDVRVTPRRFDPTATALSTWTSSTSNATDFEWFTGSTDIAEASVYESGSTANDIATLGFYVDARTKGGVAGTAELFTFAIIEGIATNSDLPDS